MTALQARAIGLTVLALVVPAPAQTVTVTTAADVVDIDWTSATLADLPGPDGKVSLSEALVATDNTPGHQTIGFAIPQSEWTLQFVLPGRAVLTTTTGFFWRAFDEVTLDGTTQTAFTGDTNPDGNEVALYGNTLYLNADDCVFTGFDSSNVSLNGAYGRIEGNTGKGHIDLFGGGFSLIKDNEGGTLRIDRSDHNVVVGNRLDRVRIWGFEAPAVGNIVGGPELEDRNVIRGYGSYNSEGIPSGHAIQLFATQGTVIRNNWIGTADGTSIGNAACTLGISIETHNDDLLIQDNLISGIYGKSIGPHFPGTVWGRSLLAWGTGSGLVISGNTIGPDIHGAPTLGAAWGLDFGDPVTNKLSMTDISVTGNEIAGHLTNGVTVGRYTPAVRLSGNSIHDNAWLGIDLRGTNDVGYGVNLNDVLDADTGGSGVQNFPELDLVLRVPGGLRVSGSLHSSPDDDFVLEFFASPSCDASGHGEGQLFLGGAAVTSDGDGDATFDVVLATSVPDGHVVTATATLEPLGATSEFSACVATTWSDMGHALAGVAGEPRLVGTGDLSAGVTNVVSLSSAAPDSLAGLFLALEGHPTPFKGGELVPLPMLVVPILVGTGRAGAVPFPFVLPAGVPTGTELWFQCAVVDASAVLGVSLSNALMGRTP